MGNVRRECTYHQEVSFEGSSSASSPDGYIAANDAAHVSHGEEHEEDVDQDAHAGDGTLHVGVEALRPQYHLYPGKEGNFRGERRTRKEEEKVGEGEAAKEDEDGILPDEASDHVGQDSNRSTQLVADLIEEG